MYLNLSFWFLCLHLFTINFPQTNYPSVDHFYQKSNQMLEIYSIHILETINIHIVVQNVQGEESFQVGQWSPTQIRNNATSYFQCPKQDVNKTYMSTIKSLNIWLKFLLAGPTSTPMQVPTSPSMTMRTSPCPLTPRTCGNKNHRCSQWSTSVQTSPPTQ